MRILTIGTFDLFHWGHADFLKRCAKLGDLIVGVNTDKFVSTFKESPVMSFEERCAALRDYTIMMNNSAGRALIELLKPDYVAVGSDWATKDYLEQIDMTQELFDEWGIGLIYLPRTMPGHEPISSTELKRRIREG